MKLWMRLARLHEIHMRDIVGPTSPVGDSESDAVVHGHVRVSLDDAHVEQFCSLIDWEIDYAQLIKQCRTCPRIVAQ